MAIRDRITQFVTYLVKQIKCSQGGILLGRVTGSGDAQEITVGSGLTLSGTTLTVTGGTFAAASHTHVSSSITDAVSDATVEGSEGKLLKTANDGSLSLSFVFAASAQASEMTVGSVGTNGVLWILGNGSPGGINNANQVNGLQFSLPTTSGNLAVTDRTDGAVSYNDLVDVPTTVPLTSSKVVANAAARLALTLEQSKGFAVVDADTGKTWMLVAGGTPATSGDWLQLGDRDISLSDLSQSAATSGQVPTWNGSAWAPATPSVTAANITDPENLAGFINVKSSPYNATGNGTTDDTAAIQAAIAAAASAGHAVFFPKGTYKISDALAVGAGCRLIGEEMVNTIIIQTGTNEHGIHLTMPGPLYGGAEISRLTVRGPGKSATTGYGIFADGTAAGINQSAIRDCEVQGWAVGMRLSYWNNSLVERCKFGRSTYESTIGLEVVGNSNANVFSALSVMSSTTGIKLTGGSDLVFNGLDMGGGGQTRCIDIAGAVSAEIHGANLEYWCVGDSASNIAIDNRQASSTLLLDNVYVRNGAGSGSGYSLACSTGVTTLRNCGLSLAYSHSGNSAPIKLETTINSSLTGSGTNAKINIFATDGTTFKTQSTVGAFPADSENSGTSASANRGKFYHRHLNDGVGSDDSLNLSVRTSAGTFAWANLLDYYTDKKTGGGTVPAWVGASNTFSATQNIFHSDTNYITGLYVGASGASGAANKSAFVLCRADGWGPTGSLNGDTMVVARTAGRLVFATSASGTQTIRGWFKTDGVFHLVSTPTYADNAAALAGGLAAGDVYRTSTGVLMIAY